MSEYVFKTDKPIKTCSECDYRCGLNIIARQNLNGRHENCPLVELPPHGELKDTDAIVNTAKEIYCKGCNNYGGVMCRACLLDDCLSCIDDAPTIIEASKA